jgi:AGZA family xanthine/uracil permease-like MFS transporter
MNKFFHIEERHSSLSRELLGGLTTFLAMFYILPVNGFMLGGLAPATPGAIFAATAISAGLTTILMGIYANYPVALASGIGINAFVAYTVCSAMGFTYPEALAATFTEGIIFIIISITPLRSMVINAIPKSIKTAIGAGIGFFIAFIGLKNAGIIVANPSTYVALGDFTSAPVLVALLGIVLVLALSHVANKYISRFAVIISLVLTGIIAATLGQIGVDDLPKFVAEKGALGSIGDISNLIGVCFTKGMQVFTRAEAYPVMFSMLFIDFFDTAGTLVAVGNEAGFIDDNGQIVGSQRALLVDAVGTVLGAVSGTTTVTSYVESTTGIAAGARTGLSSVVVGLLFILSLAIYPALGMFSSVTLSSGLTVSPVTSLALVYVGCLMFKQLKNLEWDDSIAVFSGFITIIMMIVAYSISDGIAWGFIAYTVISLAAGKFKKVTITMYVLTVLFIAYYIVKFLVL